MTAKEALIWVDGNTLYVGGEAKDPRRIFDEVTAEAARLAREGMKETDKTILKIMLDE